MPRVKVLILGGRSEASGLVALLAQEDRFALTLSLAGRTRRPLLPDVPCRVGGFGGVPGLRHYLEEEKIGALVDATHPFAAQMSQHAAQAAGMSGVPLIAIRRPPWIAGPGDRWTMVADMREAAAALGTRPRRVFLTVGRQELAPFRAAPQHDYVIRSIDPPPPQSLPPCARVIAARGPFAVEAERALLAELGIAVIVTKNSGGEATAGKLAAARALGLEMVMVARPPLPDVAAAVAGAAAARDWLIGHVGLAHDTAVVARGV